MAFGASWCAPWPLLQPILDRIVEAGITVQRVDIDSDEQLAERFRIVSVPTLILMRGSEERRRILGAVSEAELLALLTRRR